MNRFRVRNYEIQSRKITASSGGRFVLITDQHGVSYGNDNEYLLKVIRRLKPDAVLIAGDMTVRTQLSTLKPAYSLLKRLARDYPVYYSLGNHEYKMSVKLAEDTYRKYEAALLSAGVHVLRNTHEYGNLKGDSFCFYGLEIPMEYYKKPCSPRLSCEAIRNLIGTSDADGFQVLLAHNPKYGDTYFKWGADMIVSGHYHGGIVRFSEHHGLTSPQYLLFPRYCCGDFHKNNSHMFVSAGLGEHTLPLRIHNPRELLVIDVKPSVTEQKDTEV